MSPLHIAVESWDPDYGSPLTRLALEPSEAAIETDIELPADRWRPMAPARELAAARSVIFIDGVRRIDALVWVSDEGPVARPGICASYAAGIVRAEERAEVGTIEVRRGLFTGAPVGPMLTRAGSFEPMAVAGDGIEGLFLALQQRLGELEVAVAVSLSEQADLVVVDGPLSGRQNVPGAVGYVKTHRVTYLPAELNHVVARLAPGERSPLFVSTTSWTRLSWYLRLPGPASHPWSGIVRLEASADQAVEDARRLADLTAATLPAFASVPHKDPRAPQNLFPVAGLERELRHRLGDADFVHRALRTAAGAQRT